MNKQVVLQSKNPFIVSSTMGIEMEDDQIIFYPDEGRFYLDNVEDAKKLRDMLNVWIAYQEL